MINLTASNTQFIKRKKSLKAVSQVPFLKSVLILCRFSWLRTTALSFMCLLSSKYSQSRSLNGHCFYIKTWIWFHKIKNIQHKLTGKIVPQSNSLYNNGFPAFHPYRHIFCKNTLKGKHMTVLETQLYHGKQHLVATYIAFENYYSYLFLLVSGSQFNN